MNAISCLTPPAALSFADAALARALHFSISSDHSSASSSSTNHPLLCAADHLAILPPSYAPVVAAADRDSCYSPRRSSSSTATATGSRRQQPLGKRRRSRASKRAPTTYIATDASNFRLMVQHITGVHADPSAADTITNASSATLLPADTSTNALLLPGGDHDNHLHQQQQPCFPTLDSWNVSMYQH